MNYIVKRHWLIFWTVVSDDGTVLSHMSGSPVLFAFRKSAERQAAMLDALDEFFDSLTGVNDEADFH